MKKVLHILTAVFISAGVLAQVPEKMSYQAVVRNNSDELVTNTAVGMQISILQGTTGDKKKHKYYSTDSFHSDSSLVFNDLECFHLIILYLILSAGV